MTSTPDLIDVREAAAVAGRSQETVRRWVWSGRLRARKLGRRLMIERSELDQLLGPGLDDRAATLGDWLRERERDPAQQIDSSWRGTNADLVIEERARRSADTPAHAGR